VLLHFILPSYAFVENFTSYVTLMCMYVDVMVCVCQT